MAQQNSLTANLPAASALPFVNYQLDRVYDEMFDAAGAPRPQYDTLYQRLRELAPVELKQRQQTADEFLLLNAESPRSVRFAAETIQTSLERLAKLTGAPASGPAQRLAGRLRATLDYAQVDEIIADNIHVYLESIQRQCLQIHTAVQQQYIAYPIETALAS